ncbi:MAG: FAD-dependent oxidoreductase, partial [Steroidobacteraceae bacterium]
MSLDGDATPGADSKPVSGSMNVDVAIVGGGMVGASLALGLRGLGIDVLLIEGIPPGSSVQPS